MYTRLLEMEDKKLYELCRCTDLACCSTDHLTCPGCYELLHTATSTQNELIMTFCKDLRVCSSDEHRMCPQCYRTFHVNALK